MHAFHEAGAALAVTCLNERARRPVAPTADAVEAEIVRPPDGEASDELDAGLARNCAPLGAAWPRLPARSSTTISSASR
ncbi:hypothetical protein [Paralimibaculum aggregatum]|uniref:hypothetical protein n=1 Tax=Paralimibaculum aggregatum TaxID=3036245 RepID=UPI003DA1797E